MWASKLLNKVKWDNLELSTNEDVELQRSQGLEL